MSILPVSFQNQNPLDLYTKKAPTSSPIFPIPTQVANSTSLPLASPIKPATTLSELEKKAKIIDKKLAAFEEELNKNGNGKSLKKWCFDNRSDIVKIILQEHRFSGAKEGILVPIRHINEQSESFEDNLITPQKMIHKLLDKELPLPLKEAGALASLSAGGTRFVSVISSTLGGAAALIFRKSLIDAVEKQTEELKNLGGKEEDLIFLKGWIKEQRKYLKEELNKLSLNFCLYLPKGSSFLWGMIQTVPTTAGLILSTLGGGINIVKKSWEVTKQMSQEDALKSWEVSWNQKALAIYEKKKRAAKKLKKVLKESDQNIMMSKERDLQKETRSTLVRNAFRTYESLKVSFEKDLQIFSTKKSLIDQFFITFFITSGIAFKILAAATLVVVPTALLASFGLIPFLLSTSIAMVGLVYLYKTRPNMFKEVIRFVEMRLSFVQIPYAIQNWRLEAKRLSQMILMKKMEETAKQARFNPSKKGEAELSKKIKEWDKLDNEIVLLENKVNYWHKKVEILQKRLSQAALNDYLQRFKMKNPADALTDLVMNEKESFDETTQEVMKERFKIDLKQILALPPEAQRAALKDKLTAYFSLYDKEMVRLSETQLKK